jgi:hypothetical protein
MTESDHIHQWVFVYTIEDWWDGDEEDVYECSVDGCKERKREYIPR